MASQTITRLYDNHAVAVEVVQQLEAAGLSHSDISLVSNDAEGRYSNVRPTGTATGLTSGDPDQGAATGAGTGASLGTALGGGAGLLGSLTGAGVSEADAHVHAEGVRRGGTLVTVRADETLAARVSSVLDGRTPVDLTTRRTEYEAAGWKGYDPAAASYTAEQVTTERTRRVVSMS